VKLSDVFKILKGPLKIEKVRCQTTGFAVEGPFSTPALFQLSEEQLQIVELLVIHGGNLKNVAKDLKITYPTLKNRLDEISNKVKSASERLQQKRSAILDAIEQGKITPEQGAKELESL
jgi:hypothetical protein